MIDSNVIVSAVYNPKSKPARVIHHVCENYKLVLCDYIVAECYGVISKKFPHHTPAFDRLLESLGYELVATPRGGVSMSDPKDAPILNAAIIADVDIVVSGDKHFLSLGIEQPKVLTPAQYLADEGLLFMANALTGQEAKIEKRVCQVCGSFAVDGMTLDEEQKDRLRRLGRGEITLDEAKLEIIEKYHA